MIWLDYMLSVVGLSESSDCTRLGHMMSNKDYVADDWNFSMVMIQSLFHNYLVIFKQATEYTDKLEAF